MWVLLVLLFLGGFVVGFFLLGKFDLNHMLFPVVDRPCLALVRQCRKKKTFARPSSPLCSFPTISPLVSPLRYEMVGTVAGQRCSKVPVSSSFSGSLLDSPFSISDSPLVGLRPFSLPMFHPELRCVALFCGSSLSLVVLAGLLPPVTTYNHCFTFVSCHLNN